MSGTFPKTPTGKRPKPPERPVDAADMAKRLLEKVDANLQTLARQHKMIYDRYMQEGFTKDQALYLVGKFIENAKRH